MKPTRTALAAALLLVPAAAHGQRAELYFDIGATWAAPLVNDDVLEPIEVQQAIAPTLRLGAALPFAEKFRAGAEVAFATGGLSADYGGASNDLPSVSTVALVATVGGPVHERLRWRAVVGTLKYLPSEDSGIFAEGGPFRPLAGLGLEYRLPLHRSFDLRINGRADIHSFTTDELASRGFGDTQWVPRFAIGVGLARTGA